MTERERVVLRLLVHGHDAKSIANRLDLSIHAVNERLRKARRKLGVASSREAARLLLAAEHTSPNLLVAEKIGLGGDVAIPSGERRPDMRASGASRPTNHVTGAVIMVLLLVSAVAFWASREGPVPVAAQPHVVVTSPSQGGLIPSGPFTLSVTFDRAMRPDSYSFVQMSVETYPRCDARARLSRDRRTYTLRCVADPRHRYEIWFNREPYMNFQSLDGAPSAPYRLVFGTR